VFDWITQHVADNPWTYVVIVLVCAGDVIFPLLPSETVVITAGIVAANHGLEIWLVVPLTAVGAFVGDNIAYQLGDRIGEPVARRLFRGESAEHRLRWAEETMRRHGAGLIVAGRFIPGGRTATTFTAGTMRVPLRRLVTVDALAAVAWALYVGMLGYIGGSSFEDSLWKPLLLAAGVAALVSAVVELLRRRLRARERARARSG
jgi:membrane protein DedA with SNARE-associated domain